MSQPDRNAASQAAQLVPYVQAALPRRVPPALRGVSVGCSGKAVRLLFYFDGAIAEEDREAMQIAATEVVAALPDEFSLQEEIVRTDAPEPMDPQDGWAYRRSE